MRTSALRRVLMSWGFLLLVVGLLGMVVSACWAGMAQSGMRFGAKGAPMPAAGPPGAMREGASRGPHVPNLAVTMPGGQPSPVTREKTEVKLAMVAKYGDEKDEDLRKYETTFKGEYTVRNKDKKEKATVNIYFPFPGSADTLLGANVMIGDHEPAGVKYTQDGVWFESEFAPDQVKSITVTYRALGTEDFSYMLDRNERIKRFKFALTVSGTERKPDLPARVCLEPTTPLEKTPDGWTATWDCDNLLSTRDIIIVIPPRFMGSNVSQRVDRLTWAGVASALLFGLILFTGGVAARKPVSVGQYLLVVLALAVFFPLFLYLSKHLRVSEAFWLSFLAMAFLVLHNLRRGQGLRFALGYGGFGLLVLPGLLTAAALATKGAPALVMIGMLLLVGYVVVVAPKVAKARPKPPPPPPTPAPPPPSPPVGEGEETPQPAPPAVASVPVAACAPPEPEAFCVFCGEALDEEFRYCPHCGQGAEIMVKCERCGNAICLEAGAPYRFCPGCGERLQRPAPPAVPPPAAPTGTAVACGE